MTDEKKTEKKSPDFTGNGVAVWLDRDKNGNTCLNIKILNSIYVKAFKNIPKEEKKEEPPKL